MTDRAPTGTTPLIRVVLIVQARMSSSRLPGKALLPLAGKPALLRQLERIRKVKSIHECLVATSVDPTDDVIVSLCSEQNIRYVRGSLANVLHRYHQAAVQAQADIVVRITGDCPLHDASVISECIECYLKEEQCADYVSNVEERTYPRGLDVEVFTFQALDEAVRCATSDFDCEHVTPFIRRNFRSRSMTQSVNLGDLRWTLDFREDYEIIRTIYDELYHPANSFNSLDIYRFLLRRPELLCIRPGVPLNRGERFDVLDRIERFLVVKEKRA